MQAEAYSRFLSEKGVSEKELQHVRTVVGLFTGFLSDHAYTRANPGQGKTLVEDFSERLISRGINSPENFTILRQYCEWLGDDDLYSAFVEVCECEGALEVLAEILKTTYGEDLLDLIFTEAIPPLGSSEKDRYAFTRTILEKMGQHLSQEESRKAWFSMQHGIPSKLWKRHDTGERKIFRQFESIDAYLDHNHQKLLDRLTGLKNEGRLWYTQELDDDVLNLVRTNKVIEVGRREGDNIYVTKIPYQAKRYLRENDTRLKRYHACHCPLVREAILKNEKISSDICYCSLGHASHYITGLNRKFRGEVLESVLKGDIRCRFVFHLE